MKKIFKNGFFFSFFLLPFLAFPLSCGFFGDDGGIFASFDGGKTWQQKGVINKKESLNDKSIASVAFDPKNPRIIYAGSSGGGLFKTLDAGDLWYQVIDDRNAVLQGSTIHDIAIDPLDSSRVYLATFGDSFGRCFRSQDGGVSWEEIYKTSKQKRAVLSLAVDPFNSRVIYMGTAEGGILVSRDYGASWEALGWMENPISQISLDQKTAGVIYLATLGSGILKSTDFGRNWTKLDIQASDIHSIETLSFSPGTILAASTQGLFRSIDGGQNWEEINIVIPPNSLPILALDVNQKRNSEIYYSAGSVIYKTEDGGVSWQVYPLDSTKDVGVIEINPHFTDNILVGIYN